MSDTPFTEAQQRRVEAYATARRLAPGGMSHEKALQLARWFLAAKPHVEDTGRFAPNVYFDVEHPRWQAFARHAVRLDGVDVRANKIRAIKAVRTYSGLGLYDSKNLVERVWPTETDAAR